jgi:superfamily II DNA or RNA helicase
MELRPYQQDAVAAVQSAWQDGVRDPAVNLFCGLGKSLIMQTLLRELDGVRLVVMPSLSLVNQFCADYFDMGTYLPFCSLGDCDGVMSATTDVEQVAGFLEGEPDGILVVTYKSLAKLLEFLEGREIEGALFDESHHIAEAQYNYVKTLSFQVAYFSATPPPDLGTPVFEFSYADALNNVDPDTGEPRPWSRDFRVLTAMYTALPGDSMVETLARAIQDSGNGRVLTFHAQVNGESENSVKNFHQRCAALQAFFPDRKVTTRWMDATTSMSDRARFLRELDETPDGEVYVIHSCETISEGVDTKRCNHVFFADAPMSYRIAIQKIGRCVRLREQLHPATITIPACIPRDEYAVLATLEERDAYIREQYSALGKFSQLFDFIGCLRENDQDLLDLVLQAHKYSGRKAHYQRELDDEGEEVEKKEKPRFTLEQAVQRITGQPFSGDLAADADAAGRTIELHSLENGLESHGSGAALETLVEMEPGQYVHSRRRVSPPKGNRLQFSESPFLLSLHAPDGVGVGDGIGGSLRTAIMDYEVRPERTDGIIQMLHEFYADHGVPQQKGVRENEASLASWIGTQRKNKKKGSKPELCARIELEFPWWSWDPIADALERTITQMHAFYAAHGKPNHDGVREYESSLAKWISTQRKNKKKGLNPELCARVEREFPWWRWDPFADALERTITQMHVFYAAHGEPKKVGVRENEASLATWVGKLRGAKKKGLSPDLCARIDREFPWWSWDPLTDAFEETITQMHSFYAAHGEPNRRGVRENEALLARWIGTQRKNKKKGLNPELCARVEREFPWWSWDPFADAFERTITQMHVFYAAHGEPKQRGLRENESTLAGWKNNLRSKKKKGLNIDLCARIDREFPWWSWDTLSDAFDETITQMHVFYAAHGEPKQKGVRENEASLATWIGTQRKNKKKGSTPELCARIELEFPWWSWDPFADAFERTITQMHVFYAAHGKPNHDGVREYESSLATWAGKLRGAKKKGLSPDLCARIDHEFPWWKWTTRPEESEVVAEYNSMTILDLKAILRERGLAVGGAKPTLIERLLQDDASSVVPEEEVEQDVSGIGETPIPSDEKADDISASGKTKYFLIIYFLIFIQKKSDGGMSSDDDTVVIASAEECEGLSDTDEEAEHEDSDSEEDFAPPSKRPRDDGLDQLSKEELLERLRKKPARGYTAPNPLAKDQINALFSDSLPLSGGVVYFLDHTDFKTAHAIEDVEPGALVIPQNDRAAYEEMRRHPRFGASVVFGDFNDVLRAEARPVRGVYADFTGPLQCGLDLVAACAGVKFAPGAVVGVTITLRNPAGNDSYVNSAVEDLSSALSDDLVMTSLRDDKGERVAPIYYGAGAPMVTVFKRKL